MNPTTCAKVIVNPAAGAGKTARLWPEISSLFTGHGLSFVHKMTEAPGHAIELAKDAAREGYKMIVAVGGDGTIHEIVNGLYASGGLKDTILGIVSTGTGADYVRTVGVPVDFAAASKLFKEPRIRAVDLGIVEYHRGHGGTGERIFVNFCGGGFDAEIVRRTKTTFKALGALPAYLLGALWTLATYRNKDAHLKIDGEEIQEKICTVITNNGRYGGGGMNTAPNADLSDGLFDVLIVNNITKPDFLVSLPRLYKGTHLTHPHVKLKMAREVEIDSKQKMSLQADGELLGEVPARIRILPSALKLIV